MRALIFGLGNPILSDDAVGLLVARMVHARVGSPDVDLVEASVAGLDIVDLIEGYDKVIIVDAIQTRGGRIGELYCLGSGDIVSTPRLASPHDLDLGETLALGAHLGQAMPAEVVVYAVEVADPFTFGEELSPVLQRHLPEIVSEIVIREFEGRQAAPEGERRTE